MTDKKQSFVLQNENKYSTGGWGNGYLAIPESNSWYGISDTEIPLGYVGTIRMSYSEYAKHFKEVPSNINQNSCLIGFDTSYPSYAGLNKKDILKITKEFLIRMQGLPDLQQKITSTTNCTYCGFPHDISGTLLNEYDKRAKKLTCFMCTTEFYYLA